MSLDPDQAPPSVNDGEASPRQVRGRHLPFPATGFRRTGRTGSRRALAVTALIPAAVILLAACSSSSPPPPVTAPAGSGVTALPTAPDPAVRSLTETGSSLLYPLFNKVWAPAYQERFPNITITTANTNSDTGISSASPASINAEAGAFAATTPSNGTISLINASAPGAYPIVNYEYAIVSTRQPSAIQANDLKALLSWILTTGSSPTYLDRVKFQPLPSRVSSISHALAAKISS